MKHIYVKKKELDIFYLESMNTIHRGRTVINGPDSKMLANC